MLPAVTMIKVLITNLIYFLKKYLIIDILGWEQSWVLDLLLICCITVCVLLDLSGLKTRICRWWHREESMGEWRNSCHERGTCWRCPFGASSIPSPPSPTLPITSCIQPTLDSIGDRLGRSTGHREVTPGHTDSENRTAHTPSWAVLPLALGHLLLSPSLGCALNLTLYSRFTGLL